ncbi:sugar 3,4-ketoisomerase [Parendozoicomonas haliclonae]|uniref:TDP-4-oxo-6-deoxy-alpha-D-glucose-3, 4-oxoisomerase n=1 Tax=Parendozoicomonas haliclonae TaxID=1960125 RepID=A0A1X7ADB0_9GAMM|nr:FdtA/QdtA family cupin domain-containing protein [Parendozoicomonas haliclonae]SMA31412.1 TDP-4-oxo-6-deoxy-alpha-D-glucose-3, 4-oxoisomerase [Parendozoicomonas haliclonae]
MQPELISFKELGDERGALVALEQCHNIPFEIKRVYYIYGTQENVRRGFHAHKELEQVAICVKGGCSFSLDDGKEQAHCRLESPTVGLYMGAMLWHEMYDFTDDCVLMVLASDHYDEADYIRHYDTFIEMVA